MPEGSRVPLFGNRVEGCAYVVRPSAYVLVRNSANEIAVARTPKDYFLPGGGIEAGETAEQAAVREAEEECGLVLSLCNRLASAVEFVQSAEENAYFEKRSTFFQASLRDIVPAREPDHDLVWLKLDEAMELLSHGSHRWTVTQLRSSSNSGA